MAYFSQNKCSLAVLLPGIVIFSLTFIQAPVFASSKIERIDIKQAIEQALNYNPEFSSALHSQLAAEERLQQSKALYLPSLEMVAESGYATTRTALIPRQELYQQQVSLTMTQLLFDGFATRNNIKGKKSLAKAAEYQGIETAELIALEATNNFLNILRQRELLEAAKKSLVEHNKILNKIIDGESHGKFNKGDLAQATSRLVMARVNLESIKKSLSEASNDYKRIVGELPKNNMIRPKFDGSLLPDSVDKVLEQAKELNPSLATFREKAQAAKADYKSISSNYLPTVELQLSGVQGSDVGGAEGDQSLGSAMMVMTWDLYNGGRKSSRVKEVFHEKEIARYSEIDALYKLESDIKNIWTSREISIKNIGEFRQQVKANKKVAEVYYEQFELNRRSLLDLLNTQNELLISRSNLINAVYGKLFADYRLVALRGDLLKSLGIDPSIKEQKIEMAGVEPAEIIVLEKNIKILPPIEDDIPQIIHRKLYKEEDFQNKKEEIPPFVEMGALEITVPAHYMQFGSFKKRLEAEEKLGMISEENNDLLQDVEKVIQQADLGEKGIYYRLQAGPLSKQAAVNLCSEFKQKNAGECFIVKR